jgi:hypothetical protein
MRIDLNFAQQPFVVKLIYNFTHMTQYFAKRKIGVGHCDISIGKAIEDRPIQYITVLRDPVERCVV